MAHPDSPGSSRSIHPDDALIEALTGIAFEAAREALGLRARRARRGRERDVETTPSGSPEERARRVILGALSEIAPRTPIIAAGVASPAQPSALPEEFFLVAPIDAGDAPPADLTGDATLDIALVRAGEPALGVVYAPGLARLWTGRPGLAWTAEAPPGVGVGASRRIRVRTAPGTGVTAIARGPADASDLGALLSAYHVTNVRTTGSALRFCLLAEGSADIHPDLGRSMAWSTAAGDAVLRAAGGRTLTLDGEPLRYGGPPAPGRDPYANPKFVALGTIGLKAPAAV